MSMKTVLRDFLPDGAELCRRNTIYLSNGTTIEVDGDPVCTGAQ